MSHQCLADAFAPADAEFKRIVMVDTWGHLAPERNKSYTGQFVFTQGEYGDLIPIRSSFEGLPDSPWFYADMMEFIIKNAIVGGQVYRFTGRYQNHRFIGKITAILSD